MRSPSLELSPDAWSRLASSLRGSRLSWLDASGSGDLGGRSHLAWGPSETVLARFEDHDPFAPLRAAPAPGWVGDPAALASTVVLTYDAAWSAARALGLRRSPRIARPASSITTWVRHHRAALTYEHATGRASFGARDEAALNQARKEIEAALASDRPRAEIAVRDVRSEPASVHEARITAALEAIGRGELYQVNLARPFRATYAGEPFALAEAMRRASPVPLGAYLEGPEGRTLIARTMERFLWVDPAMRRIESRPIKGTIDARDGAHQALLASTKERAEHAMIVDLVRNDLGRVATPGSVRTPALFAVEPYVRLSHLVSVIEAELREGVTLEEILLATFPPASISGAPKLAAMEHIEALEGAARGPYTGALGMIAGDGSLSLAVAIRTAELVESAPGRGTLTYFSGGGIVEASDPTREVEETDLKARALLDALLALETEGRRLL